MSEKRLPQVLERIAPEWGRYLSFSSGWDEIVGELDKQIAEIYPDYELYQVKEKFGGLRYYCQYDDDDHIDALIREAEAKAAKTCEICGAEGCLHERGGWFITVCSNCAQEGYKPVGDGDDEDD